MRSFEEVIVATKISWCDETINPIVGCSKISAGCQNCYAENMARRLANMGLVQYKHVTRGDCQRGHATPFNSWNGKTCFVPSELEKPHKWKKSKSIFVGSMGDVFHDSVDEEWLNSIMEMTMCCPQHTFIFLTKRPQRMSEYFTDFPYELKNVVLGVSAEDQQTADERIRILLRTPAAKRFVSLEPLLGPVDLYRGGFSFLSALHPPPGNKGGWKRGLDGVIVGGESGNRARPLDLAWVRAIRDQCSGLPFMFKQWGSGLEKQGYPVDGAGGLPVFDGEVHWRLAW